MSEDTNEVVETTVSTTAQHEYGAAQIDKLEGLEVNIEIGFMRP